MSPCHRIQTIAAAALAGMTMAAVLPALAQDGVVAKVNGRTITEADVRLADAEIGSDLGNLPPSAKRRVLVEYLIENQLFAEAAEGDKLGSGAAFDERMQYWRRRALRDSYFDKSVKETVVDAEAKAFYDTQVAKMTTSQEVKARHILVESQEKAKEISAKIAGGADFASMAKEFSGDPGTKDAGGELGYFGRGQMVPQFEEAAFKLKKGEMSAPVQTQFGWHLIKIDDTREQKPPEFAAIKERIVAAMVQQKAQKLATDLRSKAKVEFLDADIKKQVEDEQKPGAPTPKQ